MKTDFPIDFVIPWVDGSDPEWIREFNKYAPKEKRRDIDSSEKRYRDYGLLRYWFRGVEKFAPWVRKVHFITCGQKPEWLNLDAPKLHWVKHSDYIPQEYLPVFSSHPIELMMHKIPGLAEQIVYFNDDFFLTAPVRKNFFFKKRLPCDCAVQNAISDCAIREIVFNDLHEINSHFSKRRVIKKYFFKFFNPKYGFGNLRSLCLLPWPKFTGFLDPHFAQPFKKSTLEEVWANCNGALESTMRSKFRALTDINQWLFRYWHLCKGEFHPANPDKDKKFFELKDGTEEIYLSIEKQKYKEIVISDNEIPNFDEVRKRLAYSFEKILPEKSSFER